ncbi:hypothetical protein ACFV4G_38110 [Kitasatospora sp. NPDC059747]|uniref:hypothetical protein n=1 Tax=Kitasatospora sp. NPDC059747 TaxID=3346930 RepID=UPI00365AB2D6
MTGHSGSRRSGSRHGESEHGESEHGESRLGPVVAHFRGTIRFGGYLPYIGSLALIAGVAGVVTGALLNGLYGLVVGVLAWSPSVLAWRHEVEVHQQGFVWRRPTGTRSFRYAEIRSVQRTRVSSFLLGTYDAVTVTLLSGHEVLVGPVQDTPRLARLLAGAEPAPVPAWQPPDTTGRSAR